MQLSNANKGIKIIFTGGIIGFIATIVFELPSFVIESLGNGMYNDSLEVIAISSVFSYIGTYAYSIVSFISFLLIMIGAIIASKDEKKFIETVVAVIITIVSSIISLYVNSDWELMVTVIVGMCDLWAVVAVLQGCVNIADRFEDTENANKGVWTLKVGLTLYIVAIVLGMSFDFFATRSSFAAIGVVVVAISEIVQIGTYMIYITYLARVKKMIKRINLEDKLPGKEGSSSIKLQEQ